MVWRNLGLNPGLPDHWRTLYLLVAFQNINQNTQIKSYELFKIFQDVVLLVLLHGCTTRTLTKCLEKKLDRNYMRVMCDTNPGSSTLQYSSLRPLTSNLTNNPKPARHVGHCWRRKDELIIFSNRLLHMDIVMLADHQWHTFICSVRTVDATNRDGWQKSIKEMCNHHALMMMIL